MLRRVLRSSNVFGISALGVIGFACWGSMIWVVRAVDVALPCRIRVVSTRYQASGFMFMAQD